MVGSLRAPLWLQAAFWLPLTLAMCLALLPVMKGAAVGLCWATNLAFAQHYGVQLVSLLMHIPVFVGIFTFRRYIIAAHQKIEAIIQRLGYSEDSPIPARFCQWMTDLMAAGYVLSYFIWLSLLFLA